MMAVTTHFPKGALIHPTGACALPRAFCAVWHKKGELRRSPLRSLERLPPCAKPRLRGFVSESNNFNERSKHIAIYHLSIKIISRGKGKSAVAAAAYRSGEKITNEYDGIIHDYTRKSGVEFSEILLPKNAPSEYSNRSVLWNAVEKIEKAKNSQLAREIEIALPKELTREQNISLVHDYVKQQFVSAGMCADICVHDKGDGNPHAHIMLTMRSFEQDRIWGAKAHKINGKKVCTTDWNEQTKAEQWRAEWAHSVNAVLEKQGVEERVDHRSYERQKLKQLPTVHMGVAATQMESRGIRTERGDRNREIGRINKLLRNLKIRIEQLKYWLKGIAYRGNTEEKPSVLAKLESYKKTERNTAQKRKNERSR